MYKSLAIIDKIKNSKSENTLIDSKTEDAKKNRASFLTVPLGSFSNNLNPITPIVTAIHDDMNSCIWFENERKLNS